MTIASQWMSEPILRKKTLRSRGEPNKNKPILRKSFKRLRRTHGGWSLYKKFLSGLEEPIKDETILKTFFKRLRGTHKG
jgi:hypothetical protein